MKAQAALFGVGAARGVGDWGETGQGDDSALLSVCHFLEPGRRAPPRDRTLACVSPDFECRLYYTVHGSLRVLRERLIYLAHIMNVGFVLRSRPARMFSLMSPRGAREVGFDGNCEIKHSEHDIIKTDYYDSLIKPDIKQASTTILSALYIVCIWNCIHFQKSADVKCKCSKEKSMHHVGVGGVHISKRIE